MKNCRTLVRPAETAIAAVIALTSIPAFAQTTDPAAAPPATAGPVVAPAPVAPPQVVQTVPSGASPSTVFAPSAPVVQQVPPAPAPVAESVADAAPAAPSRPATEAARTAEPAQPKAASPKAVSPVPASVSSTPQFTPAPATPLSAPGAAPATEPAVPPAAPLQQSNAGPDETAEWALGLGALAVIAGIGVLALRRRRSVDEVEEVRPVHQSRLMSDPVAAHAVSIDNGTPDFPADDVEPVERMRFRKPLAASVAAAPVEDGEIADRREAMISAQPTAENPFLTRKNRLRRANFLLRSAGEMPQPAEVEQVEDRRLASDPVRRAIQVSYGSRGGALRPPALQPRYT